MMHLLVSVSFRMTTLKLHLLLQNRTLHLKLTIPNLELHATVTVTRMKCKLLEQSRFSASKIFFGVALELFCNI